MIKLSGLFALLFVLATNTFSQYDEIIYLKNGSIVRGRILEIKPNEYVKFATRDNNLWHFAFTDVEKFELHKSVLLYQYNDTLQKGHLLCDIGFLAGTVENDMKAPLTFSASYHYNLYNGLHLGLGSGLEFYQMTYIPLFADLRYKPQVHGLSVFMQIGYSFPINKEGKLYNDNYKFLPGILINPGISYTFRTLHNEAFNICIGYRYQETNAERINTPNQWYYQQEYSVITRLNRFNIRFGYIFR